MFEIERINAPYNNEMFLTEAFERFAYDLAEKQEELLKKYIQEVADENNVGFKCAKAFIQKYMYLVFDIKEQDGRHFLTLRGEFKPIEEVLNDDSVEMDIECKNELWGGRTL